MLIMMAIVAVGMGFWTSRAHRQQRAVQSLQKKGWRKRLELEDLIFEDGWVSSGTAVDSGTE